MISKEDIEKEVEEIVNLVRYSVLKDDRKIATDFIKKHQGNPLILSLLKEFYSALPEGIEEPVVHVATIRRRRGSSLVTVSTPENEYIYFVDTKRAVYICRAGEKIDEQQDILNYFDYGDGEEVIKESQDAGKNDPQECNSLLEGCPVCSASAGEVHEFGCPLEICPWCDGQLLQCNCRFDKLGVDEITDEEQLLSLFELLNEKGRIVYSKEQGLSYPLDRKGE